MSEPPPLDPAASPPPDSDPHGSIFLEGDEPLPPPARWPGLLALWFGLSHEVRRLPYALSGFGLILFKYACEAGLIYLTTGRFFSPVIFLTPLFSAREILTQPPAPSWLGWAIFIWTLPFLWIAVSMSIRRAANAGATAWLGLLVLVPGVNYVMMILLCVMPERSRSAWEIRNAGPLVAPSLKAALLGTVVSMVISAEMLLVGVYLLRDYGATLFLGTPILMGAVSSFLYNRPYRRDLGTSLAVAQLSILLTGVAMLLFALEGVICLAMLYPIAMMMGLLGGLVGYAIAVFTQSPESSIPYLIIILPALAGAESLHRPTPLYEVVTTVEINAPPEQVWPHVIGFTELPDPPNWYFQLGIAYPKRATIQGSGVGAVRHCEFSTGPFVEPITCWEPPHRLSFDVRSQPPPMHELSPYRHVHPPHLDGYLRCKRGEFRLIELPGGRTRLEGSTWYELEMYPQDYWTLWTNGVIHRIHTRVLNHIRNLAEADNK